MDLTSTPIAQPLQGPYRPPGDKSISHRLAILTGLATGHSTIRGFLDSEDTLNTARAMQSMGVGMDWARGENGWDLSIQGGRLHPPSEALDFGNSGTGCRLMTGVLSAMGGQADFAGTPIGLVGDPSLSRRPMGRVIDPLCAQGAVIESVDGHAPLTVFPQRLIGQTHRLPMASAQVKSALLLAGMSAEGTTHVEEPAPSRDHTERLLPAFGVDVVRHSPTEVSVAGGQTLQPGDHEVPGDISSAAFVLAAGLLVPGAHIVLNRVGLNPTRDGFLKICEAMGADLTVAVQHQVGDEPVGQIEVRGSRLVGATIEPAWVPLAIDEFPIVMGLAAAASGTTTITQAEELRVKESDRLAQMCSQLKRLGVRVTEHTDGAVIEGGEIQGGVVDCGGDHRIAMTFAVLGLIAQAPIVIRQAHWMETSYPGFVDDMNALGAQLEWQA